MSTHDRTILLVIPLVAAVVAFWFLGIAPKREDAKKLEDQIVQLRATVQTEEASAQAGLEARKHFPRDYHRLVVLGKAVPVDDDTPSFLVQIEKIADKSGVQFRKIEASSGSGAAAGAVSPAPATESSAALLPIGATVGSAGLPTLPYELTFTGGNFFQIANFMAGVDHLVKTHKGRIAADGRLVTIDGFELGEDSDNPFPKVLATLSVTTYVTPADQGLTGGATPTGPSTATTVAAPTTAAPAPTTASATTPAP
jgi:Tfp pilus assembly protein PilO